MVPCLSPEDIQSLLNVNVKRSSLNVKQEEQTYNQKYFESLPHI